MDPMTNDHTVNEKKEKRFGCLQVLGLMLLAVIITAGVTLLIFKTYFFPSEFQPVTLTPQEEQVLSAKLDRIESIGGDLNLPLKSPPHKPSQPGSSPPDETLKPEPYSEKDLPREINFTEKELNALLAKNTDLANKVVIDLSEDLISAKLLLPVDPDFPMFGGKVLRLRSGMSFSFNKGKPVVMLKGITFMGVPVPNAWMGGIKNIDLVEKFGAEKGFWKTFSEGVEDIKIEEGILKIKLKE